jgi:hypothetical protein
MDPDPGLDPDADPAIFVTDLPKMPTKNYTLRLSQACDICDRSLEVIVKEGLTQNAHKP